jgi:hypothetical protein
MTLAIGLVNPEGIVMAADSRQSYRHAAVRIGSDSAIKVFELSDTVVAATSGYAFLRLQNAATPQNISTLVEDFKPTVARGTTVLQIATALHTYFSTIYAQHIVHFPAEAVAPRYRLGLLCPCRPVRDLRGSSIIRTRTLHSSTAALVSSPSARSAVDDGRSRSVDCLQAGA